MSIRSSGMSQQKVAGKDPDFHRRDLWDAIEGGAYPEYELGLQLLAEEDKDKVPFDILDATKIWPEDVIPVQRVGELTLNRNPNDFFAETEQVAFHPGHLVSGIDVSDDPLLQGRLFPIWTPNSIVSARRISRSCRLTSRPPPSIIFSRTVSSGSATGPAKRTMNPTLSAEHCKEAEPKQNG